MHTYNVIYIYIYIHVLPEIELDCLMRRDVEESLLFGLFSVGLDSLTESVAIFSAVGVTSSTGSSFLLSSSFGCSLAFVMADII